MTRRSIRSRTLLGTVAAASLVTALACGIDHALVPTPFAGIVPDFRPSHALLPEVTGGSPDRGSASAASTASMSNTCSLSSVACGYTDVTNVGSQFAAEAGTYWNTSDHPWGASFMVGTTRRFVWYVGIKTPVGAGVLDCADVPTSGASAAGGCWDIDWYAHSCPNHKNRVEASAAHRIITVFGVTYRGSTDDADECSGSTCGEADSRAPAPGSGSSATVNASTASSRTCVEGDDGSGTGGGTYAPNLICHNENMTVEISYDGGATWSVLWEGPVEVCQYAE